MSRVLYDIIYTVTGSKMRPLRLGESIGAWSADAVITWFEAAEQVRDGFKLQGLYETAAAVQKIIDEQKALTP